MKKRWLSLSISLILLVSLLTACGGSADSKANSTAAGTAAGGSGWTQDAAEDGAAEADSSAPASQALEHAKIIYSGDLEVQTQDFEQTDTFLRALVSQLGGYLESSSVSGEPGKRYGSYTARVPQEQFDPFFAQVGDNCHVIYSASQQENITEQYVDVETRLSSLRTKHDRLLALLAQADTMDAIIALESELADTEYQIESYTASLRQYDSLVDFSTIRLAVSEVSSLDPVAGGNSFFSELGKALRSGGHGILSFARGLILVCAAVWPVLVLAAVAVLVIVRLRRCRKAKMQPPKLPSVDKAPADDSSKGPKT